MSAGDWIGGLALAMILAVPFGLLFMLFHSLTERPSQVDIDEPLVTDRDIKFALLGMVIFLVLFGPLMALMAKADRQEAESWQSYSRDHKCVVVGSRSRTEYRPGGYPGTTSAVTVKEYLWRCEGGDEHWRR